MRRGAAATHALQQDVSAHLSSLVVMLEENEVTSCKNGNNIKIHKYLKNKIGK